MQSATIVLTILMAATSALADEKVEAAEAAKNAAALAAAMKEAKVSLASGLQASEKEGRPISGKFEVEDGKLQLSVYTMKGDKFFEVLVDYKSGKIVKTEPISSGDDLAEAKKQAEAMAKAKRSLREVVASAEKANPGFKAVGIEAELRNGTAQADVALLKGAESVHIEEKL